MYEIELENLKCCVIYITASRSRMVLEQKNNKKQEDIGMVVVILLYIKVLNGDVAHVYI